MTGFAELGSGIGRGLPDAPSAAARWSTLPATMDVDRLRRYRADVEATVYFCCSRGQPAGGVGAAAGTTVSEAIPVSGVALTPRIDLVIQNGHVVPARA